MLSANTPPTLYDAVYLYGEDYGSAMSDYPIWDESKREWLNQMIFEHFQYRVCGQETAAYTLFLMRRTMRECMVHLNPVFEVLDAEIDIMSGYTNTTETGATEKSLFSATPQTQLSGEENYATNLTDGSSDTHTKTHGRSDDVGGMITKWASSVNNALYLVYNELEPCFLQVF